MIIFDSDRTCKSIILLMKHSNSVFHSCYSVFHSALCVWVLKFVFRILKKWGSLSGNVVKQLWKTVTDAQNTAQLRYKQCVKFHSCIWKHLQNAQKITKKSTKLLSKNKLWRGQNVFLNRLNTFSETIANFLKTLSTNLRTGFFLVFFK